MPYFLVDSDIMVDLTRGITLFRFRWKWRQRFPLKIWSERMKKQRKHYTPNEEVAILRFA